METMSIPEGDSLLGPVLLWLVKDPEACRRKIFEFIRAHHERDRRTGNAWLEDSIDEDYFTFGALKPDDVRQWASRWNKEIQSEFLSSVYALVGVVAHNASLLSFANGATSRVKRAAEELNSSWSPYAAHAVLMDSAAKSCFLRRYGVLLPLGKVNFWPRSG